MYSRSFPVQGPIPNFRWFVPSPGTSISTEPLNCVVPVSRILSTARTPPLPGLDQDPSTYPDGALLPASDFNWVQSAHGRSKPKGTKGSKIVPFVFVERDPLQRFPLCSVYPWYSSVLVSATPRRGKNCSPDPHENKCLLTERSVLFNLAPYCPVHEREKSGGSRSYIWLAVCSNYWGHEVLCKPQSTESVFRGIVSFPQQKKPDEGAGIRFVG